MNYSKFPVNEGEKNFKETNNTPKQKSFYPNGNIYIYFSSF